MVSALFRPRKTNKARGLDISAYQENCEKRTLRKTLLLGRAQVEGRIHLPRLMKFRLLDLHRLAGLFREEIRHHHDKRNLSFSTILSSCRELKDYVSQVICYVL